MTSPLKIGDEELGINSDLITRAARSYTNSPFPSASARGRMLRALTAILPDLRASILETAAKECDGLRDEIRRHASRQDEAMTKANWLGQETAAVHLGVAIRSLKG